MKFKNTSIFQMALCVICFHVSLAALGWHRCLVSLGSPKQLALRYGYMIVKPSNSSVS